MLSEYVEVVLPRFSTVHTTSVIEVLGGIDARSGESGLRKLVYREFYRHGKPVFLPLPLGFVFSGHRPPWSPVNNCTGVNFKNENGERSGGRQQENNRDSEYSQGKVATYRGSGIVGEAKRPNFEYGQGAGITKPKPEG